jgi:peptidoglycan/xylan/chitin deacetylase (PgdA/CDA1 family)
MGGRPRSATAAILLYHRIVAAPSDPWRMAVEPGHFAQHLELLSSHFHVLSLADLVASIGEKAIAPGALAITFDDGYRDNLLTAKPLLERHGAPATVFVTTGYMNLGRDFWWDKLERLPRDEDWDDINVGHRLRHRELLALDHEKRLALLDAMAADAGLAPDDDVRTMSAAEVRRLADGGLISIGAHTVTHPVLTRLSPREQLDEMQSSREHLEGLLDRTVDSFSYPYGDHNRATIACARTAGFACACTSARTALTAASDPFQLPRFHVDNWPGDEFERQLTGWLSSGGDQSSGE